ncbi:hypothetical protein BK809_0001301 [Diplodia seriata]|uniref:Uncharacterized protein n=1 Tax=Diplodia seriata TaxID=420778 RepID=A0A1S8B970_9PEZI|nr:hypothetical protein BK809_0001301 [Diplodia seriata]
MSYMIASSGNTATKLRNVEPPRLNASSSAASASSLNAYLQEPLSLSSPYGEFSMDANPGKTTQGHWGRLEQPQMSTMPVYECTFNFLGCHFQTTDETEWRLHSFGHFHGNTPPRSVICLLCGWEFDHVDGDTAWDARLDHLAAHVRVGQATDKAPPDFTLIRHLWQKRIIDDAEYKELKGCGSLSVPRPDISDVPAPTVKRSDHEISVVFGKEIFGFVAEELREAEDLLEVIVVTGTEDRAFVAPCVSYAETMWPELGRRVLLFLVACLKSFKKSQRPDCLLRDVKFGRSLLVSAFLFTDPTDAYQPALEFKVRGHNKEFLDFIEILRWLSAVCRIPEPGELLCSQAVRVDLLPAYLEIIPKKLKPLSSTSECGRCWHDMFKGYVLAEGFRVPDRGSQRGAELPFDVMTLLGLALYPVNFGQGLVLKGENTALIPSIYDEDDDCVQWHYVEGIEANVPLSWDRIKEHCGNIYPTKDFKVLQSKRTFVGYFPSAKVHLGTRDSGFDKVDFSGAEFDDKTEFVLGNELVGQVGTSVMNFFTAQISGKLMVHRTAHQRLRGIHDSILDKLRNSKDLPILLFDAKTKQGWLVPELSAVLHMALAWASYQHEPDQVLSNMPFADARSDGGEAAYDAILGSASALLPEYIQVAGDADGRRVSVLQALAPFFARIGQIKDQQLQRHACGLKETKDLVGYEFKEIASFEEHLQLRRSKIDVDRSGGWLRLVSCKPEMAVILCSHLKAPIQPASTQHTCPLWKTVPTDQYYLTASISSLRQLAKRCGGEETLRLYNDIYCIPAKKDPNPEPCGTGKWPCCNTLLELSKHPSKKALHFDDEGALLIGKALPRTEDHSSLRVFLRSLSPGKDEKAQNGNTTVLQPNRQSLNGVFNIPPPQPSVSSGIP